MVPIFTAKIQRVPHRAGSWPYCHIVRLCSEAAGKSFLSTWRAAEVEIWISTVDEFYFFFYFRTAAPYGPHYSQALSVASVDAFAMALNLHFRNG